MDKIIIAMSGGVDSSAAALLLKEQGWDVIGVTLRLWDNENDTALADAKRVAESLGIPHYVLDRRETFRESVIAPFAATYLDGKTPNPCILCNPSMKWGKLLEFADEMGIEKMATGHYARVGQLENGRYTVFRAASDKKDQTYALCRLSQEQLRRTVTPLAAYEKEAVRELLRKNGIDIAEKHDSQDICFIPDGDHLAFLKDYIGEEKILPGEFVDGDGRVLGTHKGLVRYTIGQRKGLELAMGHPVFVTALNATENRVVIGESEDLFSRQCTAESVNFMGISEEELRAASAAGGALRAIVKVRYAHRGSPAAVTYENGSLRVVFDEPQRAVTPGQSLVVYDGDHILAAGIIR